MVIWCGLHFQTVVIWYELHMSKANLVLTPVDGFIADTNK